MTIVRNVTSFVTTDLHVFMCNNTYVYVSAKSNEKCKLTFAKHVYSRLE
jgi:hypothetical protein